MINNFISLVQFNIVEARVRASVHTNDDRRRYRNQEE